MEAKLPIILKGTTVAGGEYGEGGAKGGGGGASVPGAYGGGLEG